MCLRPSNTPLLPRSNPQLHKGRRRWLGQEGLRQLGLTPADAARCIAVEDSPSGLTAAVAANLPTFGIIGGGAVHAPEKLLSVGAVACVKDYHEVLTHLTKERA